MRGERQTKRKYINAILQVYHSERVHESQQKSKRVNYCNDELGSRVCCSLSWEPETSPPPTHLTLLNAAAKFNKTEVFEKKLHVTLSLSLDTLPLPPQNSPLSPLTTLSLSLSLTFTLLPSHWYQVTLFVQPRKCTSTTLHLSGLVTGTFSHHTTPPHLRVRVRVGVGVRVRVV